MFAWSAIQADKGIPTNSGKSKDQKNKSKKHKKHKEKDKDKEHKKHRHRHKDKSKDKDKDKDKEKKKDKSGIHDSGGDHSKKHHDKVLLLTHLTIFVFVFLVVVLFLIKHVFILEKEARGQWGYHGHSQAQEK